MSGIPKDWWDLPQVVARSLVGMPQPDPMRPDALDVIHMDNDAIEDVRDSAERAEETGELPRMDYGRIADREANIKGAHDDDRR